MPDYEYVHRELAKDGVTLSLLWVEYCEECRKTGELPYQSTQFNKYYGEYVKKTGATMHIERKPGESMEVDWAGGSYPVWDAMAGEATGSFVFVSALSYSGYAYAEAFWSMKSEDWIQAHVHAYEYYGGVTGRQDRPVLPIKQDLFVVLLCVAGTPFVCPRMGVSEMRSGT
jgi:transposase